MSSSLLKSMRLRTLPLSLGGVMCGGLLAMAEHGGSWWAFALMLLTACALQVLSNLSNEMGDYRNGVDGADRQGPAYGLAHGLTEKALWRAINWTVVVCGLVGLLMVLASFGPLHRSWQGCALVVLGAAAIWAATHYTLGRRPYGYIGLGDLFVFVFFGLVSVGGSYFVVAHTIDWERWLIAPAVGMGLLSVGVLNINNMRDMATDEGIRRTVPLRIGLKASRWYQTVLAVAGFLAMILFVDHPWLCRIAFMLAAILIGYCQGIVWKENNRPLDKALPLWVMATFLLAVSNILSHYGL